MTRPKLRSRMPPQIGLGHVEEGGEIGADDVIPLLGCHLVEHGVTGDAGIVHQHLDGSQIFRHFFQAGGAGLGVGDIPFVNRNSGFALEGSGGRIIAGVSGGDLVACGLQRL